MPPLSATLLPLEQCSNIALVTLLRMGCRWTIMTQHDTKCASVCTQECGPAACTPLWCTTEPKPTPPTWLHREASSPPLSALLTAASSCPRHWLRPPVLTCRCPLDALPAAIFPPTLQTPSFWQYTRPSVPCASFSCISHKGWPQRQGIPVRCNQLQGAQTPSPPTLALQGAAQLSNCAHSQTGSNRWYSSSSPLLGRRQTPGVSNHAPLAAKTRGSTTPAYPDAPPRLATEVRLLWAYTALWRHTPSWTSLTSCASSCSSARKLVRKLGGT